MEDFESMSGGTFSNHNTPTPNPGHNFAVNIFGIVIRADEFRVYEEAARRVNAELGDGFVDLDIPEVQLDVVGKPLHEDEISVKIVGAWVEQKRDLSPFWDHVTAINAEGQAALGQKTEK